MDADGDGKVSRDEAAGPLAEMFDTIDANGDGTLDMDELGKMQDMFGMPGQ